MLIQHRLFPADGAYHITTIDEFADQLLNEERVCEIQLPRLTQRKVLEETEGLAPRRSKLGRALGVLDDTADGGAGSDDEGRSERYMSRSPSRSPSPEAEGPGSKTPEYWTEGSEDEDDAAPAPRAKAKRRSQSAEAGSDTGRYVSRSPSPNGSEAGRYVSRSPTRSPEPNQMAMEVDVERIDGDV